MACKDITKDGFPAQSAAIQDIPWPTQIFSLLVVLRSGLIVTYCARIVNGMRSLPFS